MTITKRVIYVECAICLVLICLTAVVDVFGLFILFNAILGFLLGVDFFISEGKKCIKINRSGEEKLSIYEDEQIEFTIENMTKENLFIEISGEKKEPFIKCDNHVMKGIIKGREVKKFAYKIVPQKRGIYEFSHVAYRITGKLGLIKKRYGIEVPGSYKVYPNMKNLKRYKLKMLNSKMINQGNKKIRSLGEGREFESLREYVSGDQYRKINWKATAREGVPIVNQFDVEKNQNVYTMIDCGHPMSYSIKGYSKLEMALNSALLLMDIANSKGDKSGVLTFNQKVDNFIGAGKGSGHRQRLMDALYGIESSREVSNYEEAFLFFKSKEKRRSLICIYTDFDTFQEGEYMLNKISILSKRNIVLVILMKDSKIHEFKKNKVKSSRDMFIKGTALEFLNEREKTIKKLNSRGVMCIESSVENINTDVINKYISIKNKGII